MEFFHAATPSFQIGEFMEFKKNDLVTVKSKIWGMTAKELERQRVILCLLKTQ